MNISKEEKKIEALARMKALGIYPETIRQFKNDGYISVSEPLVGAFYWAEDEDLARIKEFEDKHNALVYLVIRSYTTLGKMDSFLYVSDHPDEWSFDRKNLKDGETIAYVYNHDAPDCSELGYIGIARTIAAGLRRTW